LAAVVAAAVIAGSLSLNRKMILRVPKKLGYEDEEVTRLPGLFMA
jgi:hydroxymethylglutaryl-CoA reductase